VIKLYQLDIDVCVCTFVCDTWMVDDEYITYAHTVCVYMCNTSSMNIGVQVFVRVDMVSKRGPKSLFDHTSRW